MPNLSQWAVDVDRERDGVWVLLGQRLYLRIASLGRPEYQPRLFELTAPLLAIAGGIDGERQRPYVDQAVSELILVGWGAEAQGQIDAFGRAIEHAEPLLGDDGATIPYSQAAALQIIRNPRYRRVREFVLTVAANLELFRLRAAEVAAGN